MQLSIYDEISNLRKGYDRIIRTIDNPTNSEVDEAYFGTKDSNRTMMMMDSTVIRLTQNTVDAIGQICYEEHSDLCMQHNSKTLGVCTCENIMQRE